MPDSYFVFLHEGCSIAVHEAKMPFDLSRAIDLRANETHIHLGYKYGATLSATMLAAVQYELIYASIWLLVTAIRVQNRLVHRTTYSYFLLESG